MHQPLLSTERSRTSVPDMKAAARKRRWPLNPIEPGHNCIKCSEPAIYALGWDKPKMHICKYHYEEYLYDYLRRHPGKELVD